MGNRFVMMNAFRVRPKLSIIMIFVSLLLVVMIAIVLYDVISFEPRRAQIAGLVASANPNDKNPPILVNRLIMAAHDEYGLSKYVARQLLFHFNDSGNNGIGWNLRYVAWIQLIRLHYDGEALVRLYAVLAERDHLMGLSNLSEIYFHKPVSELNESECAMLIASMRIPFSETARLEQNTNELLAIAKSKFSVHSEKDK